MRRVYLLRAWLVLLGMVVIWSLFSYVALVDQQLRSEILQRHGLTMLLLSAPSGWVFTAVVAGVLQALGLEVSGLVDVVIVTAACGVAGYMQWFVLVPCLFHRWNAQRQVARARLKPPTGHADQPPGHEQ